MCVREGEGTLLLPFGFSNINLSAYFNAVKFWGKKVKNLCFKSSISASLFPHLLSSFLKKKKERKTTASAFAVILACVGVLSGIAAKSRKVLAAAHCIGDYLEASQGQSQTLANCHRCNCFEKQVSSPLTSCRKMKMGNTVIFYSVSSCSF